MLSLQSTSTPKVSRYQRAQALPRSTLFGIASAVGGQLKGPSWGCGFSIWLLQVRTFPLVLRLHTPVGVEELTLVRSQLTLEFSSFMLFSIALNLQYVSNFSMRCSST